MPTGRCPSCHRDTVFGNRARVDPESGVYRGKKNGVLSLAECGHQDCRAIVYREYHPNDPEQSFDLYPPVEQEVAEQLPDPVKRSFQEALNTFMGGHWNSSTQATRRALIDCMIILKPEDTKLENWADKGLKEQIRILVQQRILPPVIGEWADEARNVGVLSAHGDQGEAWWATKQEATEAYEFANWVFQYVFVLPAQIVERRERLAEEAEGEKEGRE